MLENEAAYKKCTKERENVHRIMKHTYDPSQIKKRQYVENLLTTNPIKRHQSYEAIVDY